MQCTLCHETISVGDFMRHTRSVNSDKTTNPAPCETERHTAIQCQHPISVIRERMHARLCDLLTDHIGTDALEIILSRVTAECSSIMHEHADEIVSEYKRIVWRINQ